jgi:hypothetical protein
MSLAASPRASSTSSWIVRHSVRYASFDSTRDGLWRVDRAAAYRTAVRHEPAGHRSRPTLRTLQVIAGHALVQNLRRGHYELAVEESTNRRLAVAFEALILAI